ncbi:chromophore lyase CpcT/CpeT [Pantanalinema rosaneae CENA516]|uniref:chromophore lyase CpcT/CpeT n=1 Tax=Pantanalinema rosaneae TaxID=1620701 RepID=UPI003D6DCADB
MAISSLLLTLANYLAGEFDNREQAIADPTWYVPLRLWQRPVALFTDDSLALFAEQANVVTPDYPYRQRLLRLCQPPGQEESLQVQYYAFNDPDAFKGAGANPERLAALTPDQLELLPGCRLEVAVDPLSPTTYWFTATLPAAARCCFSYQGELRQVSLGFAASPDILLSYDKGVDPETGQGLWGALMGPYQFVKRQAFTWDMATREQIG